MRVMQFSEITIDDDVVEALQDFLGKAQRGEIVSIAIVGTNPAREVWMARAGEQGMALVGGLETIKAKVIKGLCD